MNIKKAITQQKLSSRLSLASSKISGEFSKSAITIAANEELFLKFDFSSINSADELMNVIHTLRHRGLSKAGRHTRCKMCKKIANEMQDILPKFGNLIAILEQEVSIERENLEKKRVPSQNDLRRWALKDAVLEFYKNLNFQHDVAIVESRFDDRLVDALAPNFNIIAEIWFKKLDELKRRNDKYTLNPNELDDAETDMRDGMRGSAFEKQLDRYRQEWMKKLPR